jgi:hypothetical protein
VNRGNPWYGTRGGNNTTDKIFLLSIEETVQYFGDSGHLASRQGTSFISDQFNSARIAFDEEGRATGWRLRSRGSQGIIASEVGIAGVSTTGTLSIAGAGSIAALSDGGVRPAMWIELSDSPPPIIFNPVLVSNESELRIAIAQAGSTPTAITLTNNISLIANFVIPQNAIIKLTSVGESTFAITATRDMDAVTVREMANLTIEHIEVTRTAETIGRGIVVERFANLTMNSGSVKGHLADGTDGGGVSNFGIFTMNGGVISDNSTNGYYVFPASTRGGNGGGVSNSGRFIMNGGTISDNSVGGQVGGGAGVSNSGDFTMNGGEINNNESAYGSGGIETSGSFTLNAGKISGNTAAHTGGLGSSGIFVMNGGEISNNTITNNDNLIIVGRIVCVSLGGEFTMSNGEIRGDVQIFGTQSTMRNGTIHGNVTVSTPIGVNVGSRFTLSNGTINGSVAVGRISTFSMNGGSINGSDGIGVNVFSTGGGATFIMRGGTISNHRGGGVHIEGRNSFFMSGGIISDNSTLGNGGGVNTAGTFDMDGGIIHNNVAGENGGGINHFGGVFNFNGGWIFDNAANNGDDIQIAQGGTFNHNVVDPNLGGIGIPAPR